MIYRVKALLFALLLASLAVVAVQASAQTQVVMPGTGTPVPDGDRAGQSIAVVQNDEAYVFDLGGGAVQNPIRAYDNKQIDALYPTHLHSDHILDYPELLATYWWRRTGPVPVYGPPGPDSRDC